MFNIALFEPEIPPNTGNIIRLASNTGCALHLIAPLGFVLEDSKLRRAGLDYHEYSSLRVHEGWEAFLQACQGGRILAFSTKGRRSHAEASFLPGDWLLFGPESRGLPEPVRTSAAVNEVLSIPMRANSRSINLSNAAAVVVYEAWRQRGFAGMGE